MNYLDLLNYDLMNKILEYITDDYEIELKVINKKVTKLNNKLKNLRINKSYWIEPYLDDENPEILSIDYEYVNYSMNEFLFDNFDVKGKLIFINHLSEFFGSPYGSVYKSRIIINPTYLDIMILANRAIKQTGDYHHTFLEGLNEILPSKIYEYIGLRPIKNVRYFEFMLGS